jgi:hypothetical protein
MGLDGPWRDTREPSPGYTGSPVSSSMKRPLISPPATKARSTLCSSPATTLKSARAPQAQPSAVAQMLKRPGGTPSMR